MTEKTLSDKRKALWKRYEKEGIDTADFMDEIYQQDKEFINQFHSKLQSAQDIPVASREAVSILDWCHKVIDKLAGKSLSK